MLSIINKGTGAGGKNTNINGYNFENYTDNEERLLEMGFEEYIIEENNCIFLKKSFRNYDIIFLKQYNFISYLDYFYQIETFRKPDEAYIYEKKDRILNIKIIEKKAQHHKGSVETKLWAAPSLKKEYELITGIDIEYCLCLNNFLKNKILSPHLKYKTLKKILNDEEILVLFGDDDDYFDYLDEYIFD